MRARVTSRCASALALALGFGALVACSPQQAADHVTRQAAISVATPLVEQFMQPAQAAGVVSCLAHAASSSELLELSRHVGTRGGSAPLGLLMRIGTRPEAINCIASAGLPRFGVGV